MFPQELIEATEYLQSKITASKRHEDGRVNSIDDEDSIIDALISRYGDNVEKPAARTWYDLKLFGHYVNIKSSGLTGADNCSANMALLYCFTEAQLKCGWSHFYSSLANRSTTDLGRNYYFIVLDKTTGKVYLQSLLTLARLTPNGNNLPFQICWGRNLRPVERTYEEAYRFLLDAFKASVQRRLEVHTGYENL